MIVGIIGSGGREHAICAKIRESSKISKIFCILVMLVQVVLQKI